ncbi:MAG: c-type cytochrome [Bryobacterales bacterium]|nr:c-type cytochrome [Bryobacterales bacterium]
MRLLLLVVGSVALLTAQIRETNPFTSEKDLAEGKRFYRFYCINCHGTDGASGRGARLATKSHRVGNSDRELYQSIANGIAGSEMPGHWLDEDTIWKILTFVRTLEGSAKETCSFDEAAAERGRKLVRANGCLGCHSVREGGENVGSGRMGPDLSTMGASRPREHLKESLVKPHAQVAEKWRMASVSTAAGMKRGMLLNEDGYTIHLLEPDGRIVSLGKQGVGAVERSRESSMPAYDKLPANQIEDMVSYLCSCRGGSR